MKYNIEDVIQELVLAGSMSAKDIARSVGKPYSTFMREVNPHDKSAKLGIITFLKILEATGDTSPLQKIAENFGMTLVEKEDRS